MKAGLFASASAVALVMSPGTATAQDAPAQATQQSATTSDDQQSARQARRDDGDIVVTATRRNERLQDVPLSITAFSQEDLTEKGVVGYEGLAQNTPGVVINRASANFNNFSARGIATNGYNANLQSAVAIYIDELPISANGNSTIIDPNLFDVERVEFLRGPQGTLFGSGSLSGAVRILNKNPDLTRFDYSALADLGLTDGDSLRQRYNAMVNVPLVEDRLGIRAVGFYRHEEGYLDNLGTGVENSNTLEDWGGRLILAANFSDRFSGRFLASYEHSYPEDASLVSPSLGRDKRFSERPDIYSGELINANATFEYQFDGALLTSSSTKSAFDQTFYVELSNTFAFTTPFRLDASAQDNIFVQETRLASDPGGRFDWVVGGFYYYKRRSVDYDYRSSVDFLVARGLSGLGAGEDSYNQFTAYSVGRELAGFGQLTFYATPDFWVTGGLRYGSTEVQSFTEAGGYNSNYLALALGGFSNFPITVTPIAPEAGQKVTASRLSWKGSVSWRPSNSVTTYATVATGFRGPIVNARGGLPSTLDPTDLIIPERANSDDLINYEVGVKGRWLGGDLTANLAAYWINWNSIQVQANRTSDQIQFATNIGGATSKGIEFEIGVRPLRGLNIGLYGSFNDAKVTDLNASEAAISGAVMDARLAFPRFQGTANIRYGFDIGPDTHAFASAALAHVGSYPGLFPNTPGRPGVVNPNYDFTETYNLVNVTAGATFGNVMVTAYVENLFDDNSITYVHPEAFVASRYGVMRPRTIGIRLGLDL